MERTIVVLIRDLKAGKCGSEQLEMLAEVLAELDCESAKLIQWAQSNKDYLRDTY